MAGSRDFSTISPSAKALLMVKAQTTLPFARQADELLWGAAAVDVGARTTESPLTAGRTLHFEIRARSIDIALAQLGSKRVLEIASGLSFRGLAMAADPEVYYLDTDLADMATLKTELVNRIRPNPLAGTFRVRALDALDALAFREAVGEMPPGAIAIVHEGLLMYLTDAEKTRLATSVREALRQRGGHWITADVYVRSNEPVRRDEQTQKFLDAHGVEAKKFADWRTADDFFRSHGFAIVRRLANPTDPWPVRQTWVLEPAGEG